MLSTRQPLNDSVQQQPNLTGDVNERHATTTQQKKHITTTHKLKVIDHDKEILIRMSGIYKFVTSVEYSWSKLLYRARQAAVILNSAPRI